MDMDIGLRQIVDKIWTVGLEPMLIYFIDKIWTKIGHFFVQGLSNVKNLKQGDIFWTNIMIFGQFVDKFLTKLSKISIILTNIGHGQNLDKPWTNIGQN